MSSIFKPSYGPCCPGVRVRGATPAVVVTFDPLQSSKYVPGQLILFDGTLYVVNAPRPGGTPGTSPDYTPVGGPTGATGATGVTGATGPTGPTGPTGSAA